MNADSILFLYEGETEGEFYNIIFTEVLPERTIRIRKKCLKGIYNINKKVVNAIDTYINDKRNDDKKYIHVFVAMDREGPRAESPNINLDLIKGEFLKKRSRVKSIDLIVATQDIESWLFIEIENIYAFLRVPHTSRNCKKFFLTENFNNNDMTRLFRTHGKLYQKGKRVEGFLKNLDVKNIYDSCTDLKDGLKNMTDRIT